MHLCAAEKLNVLFLGDNGHHRPSERFAQLQPVLADRGIELVYTDNIAELNPKNLSRFDALLLYANIDRIEPREERALLEYVAGGGGFVPLHCASFCFRNSPDVVALMGAQFKSHETGVFRSVIVEPDHPIMEGFGGFESWDETYVHHLHNEKDRKVLAVRVDAKGREPWTWVRTHGKGRVFYTAWGHDQRTWGNAGFQNLIERGIRWASGDDPGTVADYQVDQPFPLPTMTAKRTDVQPFEYLDVGAKIPNYTPHASWGTQGRALSRMQKPMPAEESMKHMVVPEGFRVELFASEPDIGGKPICMAWDEKGRLWIAETYDYPNQLQPPGEGRDRIRILEDTDGDWRADRFTVFADKLSIPTSITFYRGGAIVQDGVQTLYMKDIDGDDVADQRTVLFQGWSQGDTHGGVSNFQYGLDNWIWAMQGYNHSRPTVEGQMQQAFRQGFFRFRPDGSEIEFIRSTNNNTWGLGISEEGIIFGSTANRNPSVYMPIANRYYERVRGWTPSLVLATIADTHQFAPITENVRQVDHHGGYTAGAGHALYTARHYPREYWNRTAFVNGPTGHLVGTFVLQPAGSDFRSSSPFNLLASDDEWTAPIMAEVGPDGNVWVIDWYNYIVQHNPTPRGFKTGKGNAYETDLRDKKHGRIYRVVYAGRGEDEERPFSLADASTADLVATLKHPTMLWRKQAQRLLVEQGGTEAVPALIKLAGDRSMDEIRLNVGVIHALWTLHGLGQLDGSNPQASAVAFESLSHRSAGVRRNAVQVLPSSPESTQALLTSGVLGDREAQVRLAALLALSDLPAVADAGGRIASIMNSSNVQDRWIQDAAISAAASHDLSFLASLSGMKQPPSTKTVEAAAIVAEHYARAGPVDDVSTLIASLTTANAEIVDAITQGLLKGWPSDKKPNVNDELESHLLEISERISPGGRGALVKLARDWGSRQFEHYAREVAESLLKQLDDEALDLKRRLEAARQLVEFQPTDDEMAEKLLNRISPQVASPLAIGIISSLQESDAPEIGSLLTARFAGFTPATRDAGIRLLLSRPRSTSALLDAVDEGVIQLGELSLDQKQALAAHPDQQIRRRAQRMLERGGALPDADRRAVLEQLLPITEQTGDPVAGKLVFKNQCAKCHMHSGEGAKIGPDLTGMAVHPKAELLTQVIDPSSSVEGNYRVYTVITVDGRVLSGLLASESRTAIEIFDAEGQKKVILREDIDELIASPKSIMPEGFEKQVSQTDIRDLLEFLTQRGQYVPVDISKVATITSVRGMFIEKQSGVERLVFSDWSPKSFKGVPFHLTDPQNGEIANVILLHGPLGKISARMPKAVQLPCNGPARAIHLLSGVSGWGHPYSRDQTISMIVRLKYGDGETEDHELLNGVHFADYIRREDVPKSEFAFPLRGQQMRYLVVYPKRPTTVIDHIEILKGPDSSAPVVMAVTLESSTNSPK